ncbi:carboxypeptidase-like regulatory domain-containing protein [Pararcticibacter amylolyticus]|uniref:TonB C-terminal domain-containing protein n=1 Tax=Pararcticibacter amylolyticus TaxID=2173175 RepID=A0A2U2PMH3_9SPHI|nr:carboxypeptidase-like regulatory domain-containing protein [Pararcticibacter amylolyticus]PWG82472.1 hypothetical protein DDR33_00990 [Pararcticibacter amylolyticus]
MKSNKYDISLIRKYLNGELDDRAMYALERQAQDDPLLMDLIEGMAAGNEKEHEAALIEIDDMISRRTKSGKGRIVPLLRWGIAASFLILCGLTALFLFKEPPSEKIAILPEKSPITRTNPEKVPVGSPVDTLKPLDEKRELISKAPKPLIRDRDINTNVQASVRQSDTITFVQYKKADSVSLGEVVITAYPTQAKQALTASASTITIRGTNPVGALQGRVAGVSVTKMSNKQRDSIVISGTVKDATNNSALPGVAIIVKGGNNSISSDENGHFSITIPRKGETIELSYIGFEKKTVKINKADSLVIAMNPSELALNEVVVVGYGANSHKDANMENEDRAVRPVEGWQEFNRYLRSSAVTDKGKKEIVVLSFSISPGGHLSDFTIIKGSDRELNEKAIRIVKEGPAWRGPEEGSEKVRLRIRFR